MSNQLKAKCLLVGGKPEDEAACRCSVRWRRLKKKDLCSKSESQWSARSQLHRLDWAAAASATVQLSESVPVTEVLSE